MTHKHVLCFLVCDEWMSGESKHNLVTNGWCEKWVEVGMVLLCMVGVGNGWKRAWSCYEVIVFLGIYVFYICASDVGCGGD